MLFRPNTPLLLLAILYLALAISTRAQTSTVYLDSQYGSKKAFSNVAYTALDPSLLLDVYMPTGANHIARFPAFIIMHGLGGKKENDQIVKLCQNWAKRGYVTVAISYTLGEVNTAAEAVRWMRANADTYKVDPSRIAIGGESAGAMTAMMTAFYETSDTGTKAIGPNAHVSVVLDLWGPSAVLFVFDLIPDVDKNDPPVFIVHGTADTIVIYQNSVNLANRLKSVGVDYKFFTIQGAEHSCYTNYWNDMIDGKTIDQHAAEFFYKHLNLASLRATSDPAGSTSWTSTHFNTTSASGNAAWTADPDADGAPNLLEYAFGTIPTTASSRPSVQHSISIDSPRRSVLTFNRTRSDVTYEVLASSDLSTWTVIAVNPGTVGQSVAVTDSVELKTGVSRYLRVRTTLVP